MCNKNKTTLEERAKNYGEEIVQITDFVQKARQTKDMYIGKVAGNAAFLTMVREIVQNAIDEILKKVAFSPVFYVTYSELNHQVTVEDNGRGIPHGKIGIIFGSDHSPSTAAANSAVPRPPRPNPTPTTRPSANTGATAPSTATSAPAAAAR